MLFYSLCAIALFVEMLWPPRLSGPTWWGLIVLENVLFATGIWVAYSIVVRARKASTMQFAGSCPGCGYSVKGSPSARCPECGYLLSEASDGAG